MPVRQHCFTLAYDKKSNVLINEVNIARAYDPRIPSLECIDFVKNPYKPDLFINIFR